MMKKNYYLICVLLLAAFCTTSIATAQNYFGDFPVKADPKTVGNKLSRRLMETKHQLYFDRGIHYAEVCTWYVNGIKRDTLGKLVFGLTICI